MKQGTISLVQAQSMLASIDSIIGDIEAIDKGEIFYAYVVKNKCRCLRHDIASKFPELRGKA